MSRGPSGAADSRSRTRTGAATWITRTTLAAPCNTRECENLSKKGVTWAKT